MINMRKLWVKDPLFSKQYTCYIDSESFEDLLLKDSVYTLIYKLDVDHFRFTTWYMWSIPNTKKKLPYQKWIIK